MTIQSVFDSWSYPTSRSSSPTTKFWFIFRVLNLLHLLKSLLFNFLPMVLHAPLLYLTAHFTFHAFRHLLTRLLHHVVVAAKQFSIQCSPHHLQKILVVREEEMQKSPLNMESADQI